MRFNPYAIEELYERLGRPAWFWPLFWAILALVLILGASASPSA